MATLLQTGGAPTPSAEAVRKQLQAVLASEIFAGSPRLSRFLAYVVEQTVAGNGSDLKEYRIGVDVFQRPETYDPKIDPVVRVDARQLRFKLAEYYESAGSLDPVRITVPKGAYAARFESAAAPEEQPAAPGIRRFGWLAAVVAIALAGGALLWTVTRIKPAAAPLASIAVLPFVNLSGDPSDEYFADGLTDEITDALARTRSLRLIARSSAFQFKGRNVDARQTGRELNVASILTGSVSRAAGRIKVVAQLARTSDGSVEWSHRYERTESDLFTLQASVAGDIASSLRVTLAPAAAHPATRNVQAQDYFMRARYEADQLTRESLQRAIADYERAIALDPGYAAAHYGLAVARHRLPSYANDIRLYDRAAIEREYQRAIDLDPNFPEPHTGLALLAAYGDWDWDRAEHELEIAAAIGSSAMVESHSAFMALIRGRRGEAAEHVRRARDLDPLGVAIVMNTAEVQIMAGDYQGGRDVLERFAEQHPEVENARCWLAISFLLEGRSDEALTRFRLLEGRNPDVDGYIAAAHARAGRRDQALALVHAYEKRPERCAALIAMVYGYLREETEALRWIDKSAAAREAPAVYLGVHPALAFLRGNPALQEISKRRGLSLER